MSALPPPSLGRRRLLAGAAATSAALLVGGSPASAGQRAAVAAAGPDGYAGIDALGQNGTTGGAGGPVVTVSDADTFLDYCDRNEPYVIQVSGTIRISSKQGVRSNKTI